MTGSPYRSIRDLDWALVSIALILCGLGVLQIYSATHDTIDQFGRPMWRDAWWKQLVWVMAGLVLMWIVTLIDYHSLLGRVNWFYVLIIVLLGATLFIGTKVFGSRRWIPLAGGFHFQVSEFAKIVIVMLVAKNLAELRSDRVELRELVKLSLLIGIPMALIMKQPDLGTALTYAPIVGAGVFLAGLRWQFWVAILIVVALVLPVGWMFLKDYQKARLVTFMNPGQDPRGAGYQVLQSKIAVGSGGMWGKGVTRGSQTQLRFLPVPHTDFIFSAFAEEHGFAGVVVALGLYFLLLMQIVQNAQTAPDRAGMYVSMGVCALLLFHLLVNVGMVVGRMPVTGIPLPLMSSGGSNIMSVFIMLGLVNSVRLRRFVN